MFAAFKKIYDLHRQHIKNQRHYFARKGPSSQSYGFSSSNVWMPELGHMPFLALQTERDQRVSSEQDHGTDSHVWKPPLALCEYHIESQSLSWYKRVCTSWHHSPTQHPCPTHTEMPKFFQRSFPLHCASGSLYPLLFCLECSLLPFWKSCLHPSERR